MPENDSSLGNFVSAHQPKTSKFVGEVILSVVLTVIGVMCTVQAFNTGIPEDPFVRLIFFVGLSGILSGPIAGAGAVATYEPRIILYTNGLQCFLLNSEMSIDWDSIDRVHYLPLSFGDAFALEFETRHEELQRLSRSERSGWHKIIDRYDPGFSIVLKDGKRLHLRPEFPDLGTVARYVEEKVAEHQTPIIISKLQNNDPYEFGPFALTGTRITNGPRSLSWKEVSSVRRDNYLPRMTISNTDGPWAEIDLSRYPNGIVFSKVAEECYKEFGKSSKS